MKKILLAIVVLALVGTGAYLYHAHSEKAAKAEADKAAAQGPLEVVVRTMKKQDIPLFEELPGRTTAHKVAEIRPQVSGIVNRRLFEEGSDVREGQQLYQINPAPFEAVLNSARADLLKARANMQSVASKTKRYAELVTVHAISQQEYDDTVASFEQAKADIAIAQAAVETAQINLDFTRVYAPISGRVGKSNVTEGALVTAGQQESLATITQLDPIYVDLTQSSKALLAMRDRTSGKEKTTVTLMVEDRKEVYPHEGDVQFSDVTVDPTTGMVDLRAIFPNPEHQLLPGLFVRARIHLDTIHGILLPQRAAIRSPDGGLSVWKVSADNKLSLVPVQAERVVNSDWVVSGGVEEGDVIVVSGFQKAASGASVKTLTEKEAAEKAAAEKAKAEAEAAKKQGDATKPKDGKKEKDAKGPADAKNPPAAVEVRDDAIAVPPVKDDLSPLPAKDETGRPNASNPDISNPDTPGPDTSNPGADAQGPAGENSLRAPAPNPVADPGAPPAAPANNDNANAGTDADDTITLPPDDNKTPRSGIPNTGGKP